MKLLIQMSIQRLNKKRAQATTELAIAGVLIIMLLTYLLQRGYIYNCMQSLEMYTFRKALQLSQEQERGISLTVVRDVVVPSFFTGLSRQRLISTASVEYNPYKIYEPVEEDPEDIPTRVLLQIGEAMIRNNCYIEVPPTKIKIDTEDKEGEWMWQVIFPRIDSPLPHEERYPNFTRKETYTYITKIKEAGAKKIAVKKLIVSEEKPLFLDFKKPEEIEKEIKKGDWEDNIKEIEVKKIPKDISLILNQKVTKILKRELK